MVRTIMESLFDISYLLSIVTLGTIILVNTKNKKEYILFGIMALLLGLGDSFHLIPRVISLIDKNNDYSLWLNTGKLITSITMTGFYILLYYFWIYRYKKEQKLWLTLLIWACGFVRIVLCLLPGNEWYAKEPSYLWGIYRNIPFVILGGIIITLFVLQRNTNKYYKWMWLAITLSFAFYLITVIGAKYVELLGLFMIPKTCMYVWSVVMGLRDELKVNK